MSRMFSQTATSIKTLRWLLELKRIFLTKLCKLFWQIKTEKSQHSNHMSAFHKYVRVNWRVTSALLLIILAWCCTVLGWVTYNLSKTGSIWTPHFFSLYTFQYILNNNLAEVSHQPQPEVKTTASLRHFI